MTAEARSDDARAYEEVLPLLLEDHTRHFSSNPQLFHETFFGRGQETQRIRALLSRPEDRDQTLIITGNAGVGKTSFVYRIAFAPDQVSGPAILPILADYKAAVPQNMQGCLLGFVRHAAEQFQKVNQPIVNLHENVFESVHHNIRVIHDHIARVTQGAKFPKVLIFLDDFDYAEEAWYTLLDYFLPFVQSAHCSVVLTMRPTLYASLKSYDERLRFYFGLNVDETKLQPMAAREVLASRLAPILLVKESESVLMSIIKRFKRHGPLEAVASKLGVRSVEGLRGVDFPFTERHNDFMHRITNGNLREVMSIALDSLLFILRAGDTLETRTEGGLARKVIGREGTLRLFYDNPDARFKIININKERSRLGNSLLYNVLEAIKIHPEINDELFAILRPFGHAEREIRWAIDHLADRSQRLLEVKWILPRARQRFHLRYDEYELTEKGNYYLDIARWAEYQSKPAFQHSGIRSLEFT